MSVALAAVTDDCDGLAFQKREIAILLIENPGI
jgi:hypothetical protein